MSTYDVRDSLIKSLDEVTDVLGDDELRVLIRIADRLRRGREVYGELRVSEDKRDFRDKEAREELEDALVYFACAWLKVNDRLAR